MTLEQGLSFALIAGTMALFVWGRFRYDLVAVLALLAGLAMGIVPMDRAFVGFSDDVVIIVAAALVVSAGVARSGVVEKALHVVGPWLTTARLQVLVLVTAVAVLSAFVKNVGALAMLIPVAFQISKRSGTPVSYLLMPMAFGSLIGGLATLVGTSPNVIVSRLRGEILGEPFSMFDFTPVGVGIALCGIVFLTLGYRLLPEPRRSSSSAEAAFNIESYTTEATIPAGSVAVGKTVSEFEALADGDVGVATIIRERFRRYTPTPDWTLNEGDVLLLEGEPDALERAVAAGGLRLAGADAREPR